MLSDADTPIDGICKPYSVTIGRREERKINALLEQKGISLMEKQPSMCLHPFWGQCAPIRKRIFQTISL
ncbi:hypothetical protein CK934_16605 [Chitinophaga sp. MD30]|nr:hypothetical protein CK934_16605 [Chitinophaga sp. MD30]